MSAQLRGESISKAFDEALEYFGGIRGLANFLGLTASHVRSLRTGKCKLRIEYAMKIEEATDGKIKAKSLESGRLLNGYE